MDSEKAAVSDREFVFLAALDNVVLLKCGGASTRGGTLARALYNKHFQGKLTGITGVEYFREHHYQVGLQWKTEEKVLYRS